MFNFSGSELVFLLLLALIILGPEKLPEAIRKFGQTYAEFKKVTTGFQTELKQALDEPVREMRETAEMFKQAATFDVLGKEQAVVPAPQQHAADPFSSSAAPTAADTGAAPPLASGGTESSGALADAATDAATDAASAAGPGSDAPKQVTGETVQRMRSLDDIIVRQPFGQAMTASPLPAATDATTDTASPSDATSDATSDAPSDATSDANSAEQVTAEAPPTVADGTTPA